MLLMIILLADFVKHRYVKLLLATLKSIIISRIMNCDMQIFKEILNFSQSFLYADKDKEASSSVT